VFKCLGAGALNAEVTPSIFMCQQFLGVKNGVIVARELKNCFAPKKNKDKLFYF